jgi:hypothetical protein
MREHDEQDGHKAKAIEPGKAAHFSWIEERARKQQEKRSFCAAQWICNLGRVAETAHLFRLNAAESPWGDYGRILVHGMSMHLRREHGLIQLERTGPSIAPITFPGAGDIVVTEALRVALEQSGLTGFSFQPVIKRHIVNLDWEKWDVTAPEPEEHPEGGESESYILNRRHAPRTSDALGVLSELCVAEGIDVVREKNDLRILPETWNGSDFFVARTTRIKCVSLKARRWLEQHVGKFVAFSELNPRPVSRLRRW